MNQDLLDYLKHFIVSTVSCSLLFFWGGGVVGVKKLNTLWGRSHTERYLRCDLDATEMPLRCDTYNAVRTSHTGGDPLIGYAPFHCEHAMNWNRNNTWLPMKVRLHYVTVYSAKKILPDLFNPSLSLTYTTKMLSFRITTIFSVTQNGVFPRKLHSFNAIECLLFKVKGTA
jgi:hypothetical protein